MYDVSYFNNLINIYIEKFYLSHLDTNVFLYDIHSWFNIILNNCYKYNLKDCKNNWKHHKVGSIKDYFWSDLSHPTFKVNEIFAKNIDEFLKTNSI